MDLREDHTKMPGEEEIPKNANSQSFVESSREWWNRKGTADKETTDVC